MHQRYQPFAQCSERTSANAATVPFAAAALPNCSKHICKGRFAKRICKGLLASHVHYQAFHQNLKLVQVK